MKVWVYFSWLALIPLGHGIHAWWHSKIVPNSFSILFMPIYTSTGSIWKFKLFNIFANTWCYQSFKFYLSWFIVVLIFFSLVTTNIEHLLIYLLAIWNHFCKVSAQIFDLTFKNWAFSLILMDIREFLTYSLHIMLKVLCQIYTLQISSPTQWFAFILT